MPGARWAVTGLLFGFVLAAAPEPQIPLPLGPEGLEQLAATAGTTSPQSLRDQLQDAAGRARAAGDVLSESWAQVGLAALLEHGRRPAMAESLVRAAVARARPSDPLFDARAALWLAREAERAGRFLRLRFWSEMAADRFRAAEDQSQLAKALQLAARSYRGRERRDRIGQALTAARAAGNAVDIASIQADWGEALRTGGDLAGAIGELEGAAKTLESLGAWSEAGRALTLLARAHGAHGHRREALFHLSRAETLLGKTAAGAGALRIHIEMGNLLASLGERAKALEHLEQVRLAVSGNDAMLANTQAAGVWIHGYLALGEYARVVSLVEQLRQGAARRSPPAALWMASAAYFHLGRYAESIQAATDAMDAAGQIEALSNVPAYRWRARSLDRLGRHDEAARDMLEAARLGEAVLSRTAPDDEWKRAFVESKEEFADDMIAVLWRAGRFEDALGVAERFRARAFLDLVASRDQVAPGLLNPAVSAEPRLASNSLGEAMAVDAIASNAEAAGTPVLSYWVHPECLYVWLVSGPGQIRPVRVAVTGKRLAALVEQARRMAFKPDRAALAQLHRLLILPIQRWLPRPTGGPLAVLAHGPLHRLPFGALLAPSGRYFIEDYRVRVAPAASFLFRTAKPEPGPLVLLGAPRNLPATREGIRLAILPGALREIERLRAAAPGEHVLLTGAALRTERVRQEAAKAGVLHFATHALVDELQPFESFLALSDRDKLTAGQVYEWRLRADLVTLSACRGAAGRISADGILGFPRAFLFAGAASVLAPVWDVPDETTGRLMEEFYRRYHAGASKSEALRLAQLRLLDDLRSNRVTASTPAGPMPLPEHPLFWAGFTLLGAD